METRTREQELELNVPEYGQSKRDKTMGALEF